MDGVQTLDRDGPEATPGLSRREREVLELVAQGCSNRVIARRLYISPHTAGNHLRAILRKTGSKNRTEAAILHTSRLPILEQLWCRI